MKLDKIIKMSKGQLDVLTDKAEDTIQKEIVSWAKHLLIFAVPNEATRNNSKFIKMGVLSGVSDLIVVLPNKILFVELKTRTGKQSPNQKTFEEKIEFLGFDYHIVRSLEEFKTLIKTK